jgi:hypothetical protein
MFDKSKAVRVTSPTDVRKAIEASKESAARLLTDEKTGEVWAWPFEAGTHHEGANALGLSYSREPGGGDAAFAD